ncbi:MAG: hypothetical protein MZV65_15800 [Chromatiales bacterium]|nr:hypothetical protein [Chromatiales bacterium]
MRQHPQEGQDTGGQADGEKLTEKQVDDHGIERGEQGAPACGHPEQHHEEEEEGQGGRENPRGLKRTTNPATRTKNFAMKRSCPGKRRPWSPSSRPGSSESGDQLGRAQEDQQIGQYSPGKRRVPSGSTPACPSGNPGVMLEYGCGQGQGSTRPTAVLSIDFQGLLLVRWIGTG